MKTLAIIALAALLTSCGGTFTLTPAGVISYTSPVILKAPIVEEAK